MGYIRRDSLAFPFLPRKQPCTGDFLLTELGREYARRGLVMQLHIGALRNNSSRMFEKLVADTGFVV